jgi:hypothetical protein
VPQEFTRATSVVCELVLLRTTQDAAARPCSHIRAWISDAISLHNRCGAARNIHVTSPLTLDALWLFGVSPLQESDLQDFLGTVVLGLAPSQPWQVVLQLELMLAEGGDHQMPFGCLGVCCCARLWPT